MVSIVRINIIPHRFQWFKSLSASNFIKFIGTSSKMFDLRFETFQFLIRDERTRTSIERTLDFSEINNHEVGKVIDSGTRTNPDTKWVIDFKNERTVNTSVRPYSSTWKINGAQEHAFVSKIFKTNERELVFCRDYRTTWTRTNTNTRVFSSLSPSMDQRSLPETKIRLFALFELVEHFAEFFSINLTHSFWIN